MTVFVDTTNKGTVNLRESPSRTSKILMHVPYKTLLEAEPIDENWSKVTYKNCPGYIMTEFLTSTKIITKHDLQEIYDSLKQSLETIEKILK